MKRATINDVALTAGVSTFTASRALRGKDHVAAATRDKVLKVAKELNYTASRSAAALASGRAPIALPCWLANGWPAGSWANYSTGCMTN